MLSEDTKQIKLDTSIYVLLFLFLPYSLISVTKLVEMSSILLFKIFYRQFL